MNNENPLDELLESKSLESITLDRKQAIAFRDRAREEGAAMERERHAAANAVVQDERAAFEVAGRRERYNLTRSAKNTDDYAFPAASGAWWAWQARAALSSPAAEKAGGLSAWVPLADTQWMNIVNHDHAYESYSKDDAVHEAVKRTEAKLKELNAAPSVPAKEANAIVDSLYPLVESPHTSVLHQNLANREACLKGVIAAWRPTAADSAALPTGSVLTAGQILSAERRGAWPMLDDEALRFGRAIESMTLAALPPAMDGSMPPLPQSMTYAIDPRGLDKQVYSAEDMHAYVLADRANRTTTIGTGDLSDNNEVRGLVYWRGEAIKLAEELTEAMRRQPAMGRAALPEDE